MRAKGEAPKSSPKVSCSQHFISVVCECAPSQTRLDSQHHLHQHLQSPARVEGTPHMHITHI